MVDNKDLGDIAKEEYNKTTPKAKTLAQTPVDNYFDLMGQQFQLTKQVAKTTGKFLLQASVLGAGMYTGYALIGWDSLSTSIGFIVGDWGAKWKNKEKINMKDTVVRGLGGAVMGSFLHYVFPIAHYLGDGAGAAVMSSTGSSFLSTTTQIGTKSAFFVGPVFPAFIYLDNLTHKMMDWSYKRPKGKEFWKENWRAMKYLGIPVCLNANFTKSLLGSQFEVPIGAGISAAYSFISAKPKEKKNDVAHTATAPGYTTTPAMGYR